MPTNSVLAVMFWKVETGVKPDVTMVGAQFQVLHAGNLMMIFVQSHPDWKVCILHGQFEMA